LPRVIAQEQVPEQVLELAQVQPELAQEQGLAPVLAQEPERAQVLVPVRVPAQVLVRVQSLCSRAASGCSRAQSPDTSNPARPPGWQQLRRSVFSRCCSWTQSFPSYRPARYVVTESDEKVFCHSKTARRQCGNY
jgi:hypothetical protein